MISTGICLYYLCRTDSLVIQSLCTSNGEATTISVCPSCTYNSNAKTNRLELDDNSVGGGRLLLVVPDIDVPLGLVCMEC